MKNFNIIHGDCIKEPVMNVPDIDNLTFGELNRLRDAVNERMKEMRDTGITQLRATIAEQATILGVDLKDLIPKKTRRRRTKDDDSA